MALQQYLVTKQAGVFDATGSFRPMGSLATLDSDTVGDEPRHVTKIDKGMENLPTVQMSAVAPTGPNPVAPQQIAPDARQTIAGYEQPGAKLVGEVTAPEETRIEAANLMDDGDDTQGQVVEKMQEAQAAAHPLDHDGDGRKGGSKSGAESTRAKGAAKS